MSKKKTITIKVDSSKAEEAQKALQLIADNINAKNLEILGQKSTKLGINQKIQSFHKFM